MNDRITTDRPFFFVHIMKTAGMTFNRHIHQNFARDDIYPGADDTTGIDYWVIDRLRRAVGAQEGIRLWHGHFPYFVTDMVPDAITLSVLREPVARIISLIDQHRRNQAPDQTLEQIHEDPEVFSRTIVNHQTKMFALREDDNVNAWVAPLEITDARFAAAKDRLGEVDLLGFQERFDDFTAMLSARWGWRFDPIERVNAAEERPVISDAFRRRIIDDNDYDMQLYEFARSNY